MIDIFDKIEIDRSKMICHSGGAKGSDTIFEEFSMKYGIKVNAYSYKTKYHTGPNKVEISEQDFEEGVIEIKKANKILMRWGIGKYMNLLARNWAQVKYSDEIFAIGKIVRTGKIETISGGTGYACAMAVQNNKPLYVFDQTDRKWFKWSFSKEMFIEIDPPKITCNNFAGIGTREINDHGIMAIKELYERTFEEK